MRWFTVLRKDLLSPAHSHEMALHYVIGVFCFLACLTAVFVASTYRATAQWTQDIKAEITVQVRPSGLESGATAAAHAAEALSGVSGVDEAAALEPEKAKALLKPWLGDVVIDDLPVPNLVEIRLNPHHPANQKALQAALDQAHIDATIDDHTVWLKDIEQSAHNIRLMSLILFGVLSSAAAAVVAYAARAGLMAMAQDLEIFSLVGAEDLYIARTLQWRFARLAFESGLGGTAVAAMFLIVIKVTSRTQSLVITLPIDWSDLLILLPCSFLAAIIAGVSARIMSLHMLAKGL